MKKYLFYSSVLAVIFLVGSLITTIVYSSDIINGFANRVESVINDELGFNWDENFHSNITFEGDSQGNYIHKSQYVWQGSELDIETDLVNADVKLEKAEGSQIQIYIETKNPKNYRINFEDSELNITEKKKSRFWLFDWKDYQKAQVTIKVPTEDAEISLETVNGDLSIQLTGGNLEASTINGNVKLGQSKFSEAMLQTVNGKILVSDSDILEELKLNTVNGSLNIERVNANYLEGETINGDFFLLDIYGEKLVATTVNGDFNWTNIYVASIDVDKLNGSFMLENEDVTYQIQSLNLSGIKKNHEIKANILNISYN